MMKRPSDRRFSTWMPDDHSSHAERLLSALGGFVGIAAILAISASVLHLPAAAMIVASMGASAVLLFAVPRGNLSQPWPLVGGHLVSALIGVLCVKWLGGELYTAAVAVGLAIAAMYYLRCIHPPGGATALTAVVGGQQVHELGFLFLLEPVALNVVVLLVVAVLFNLPFPSRRYPRALRKKPTQARPEKAMIAHSDLVYALSEIDSFVDISESDLLRIYDLALGQASGFGLPPQQIRLHHFYRGRAHNKTWLVRQVVDEGGTAADDQLVYKEFRADGSRGSGHTTRRALAAWARDEVQRDVDGWRLMQKSAGD